MFRPGQMDQFMKVNGKKIQYGEKEHYEIQMAVVTKAAGCTITLMATAGISAKMEICTKANGEEICLMVKERSNGMMAVHIRGNTSKV